MGSRSRVAIAALVLAACTHAPDTAHRPQTPHAAPQPTATPSAAAPAAPAKYRTVNAMPAFWTFWEEAEGKSHDEQVRRFEQHVLGKHSELFTPKVVGRSPAERKGFDMSAKLEPWLQSLPDRIAGMKRLTNLIESNLTTFDESFRAEFPDMTWEGTVYFTVSLDAFDGAIRMVNEKPALLFGLDKIILVHGADANIEPLFHHELFHVYHHPFLQAADDDRGMLLPLWSEGLAVYVAHKLNPKATTRQLVLTDDMTALSDAQLGAIAAELKTQLDETTEETYRDFFLGAGQRQDIPKRVGYYVGYRVAQELGRTRTLRELSRLHGTELRTLVETTLNRFATAK